MRATRFPVRQRQLLLVLVLAIEINQLTQRSSEGIRCDALRMINLDAPQMALLGDTIRLTCSFKLAGDEAENSRLEGGVSSTGSPNHGASRVTPIRAKQLGLASGPLTPQVDELAFRRPRRNSLVDAAVSRPPELLYAIKWYKDDSEFYQFITRNWPHKNALPMAGLDIDVDKSDNQTVVLRNVSLKTSGLFRCEVSTDAPSFVTKSIERKIFIYALPAEGPTIQTNIPASGSKRQNLVLGDQLELHCLSRDSKPNARIDWIIINRVNLTETNVVGLNGTRVFEVSTRRFVRVPRLVTTSARSIALRSNLIHTNDRSSVLAAAVPFQRRHHNETTYEVVENQGRTFLLPNSDSDSNFSANATIDTDTLDQLPEASVSVLNFTIDTNLVQFLQVNNPDSLPMSGHNQRVPTQKPISSSGMKSARNFSSLGLSFKTRKLGGDQKRVGSGKQPDGAQRLPLDIRCVARVMHLTMSDEIRLKIVDRPTSTSSSSLELRQQGGTIQKNSGEGMLYNNQTLQYLFLCLLTWMMFQE